MYVISNLVRTTGSGRKSRIKFDDVSTSAGYNVKAISAPWQGQIVFVERKLF
jgi:hypothetical protein